MKEILSEWLSQSIARVESTVITPLVLEKIEGFKVIGSDVILLYKFITLMPDQNYACSVIASFSREGRTPIPSSSRIYLCETFREGRKVLGTCAKNRAHISPGDDYEKVFPIEIPNAVRIKYVRRFFNRMHIGGSTPRNVYSLDIIHRMCHPLPPNTTFSKLKVELVNPLVGNPLRREAEKLALTLMKLSGIEKESAPAVSRDGLTVAVKERILSVKYLNYPRDWDGRLRVTLRGVVTDDNEPISTCNCRDCMAARVRNRERTLIGIYEECLSENETGMTAPSFMEAAFAMASELESPVTV